MTFSASAPGGNYPDVTVVGFSGSAASPLDQTSTPAGATSVTTIQPGSITPGQANELLVSCLAQQTGTSSITGVGIASPFTLGPVVGGTTGVTNSGAIAYQIQAPGPAAENPAWTWTGTAPYAVAG